MSDDHLTDIIEARVFPLQREFLKNLCERYPEDYPNESAAIRAALMVFRGWLAKNGRCVD